MTTHKWGAAGIHAATDWEAEADKTRRKKTNTRKKTQDRATKIQNQQEQTKTHKNKQEQTKAKQKQTNQTNKRENLTKNMQRKNAAEKTKTKKAIFNLREREDGDPHREARSKQKKACKFESDTQVGLEAQLTHASSCCERVKTVYSKKRSLNAE